MPPPDSARLRWPDTVKGIAILWIVFFHGFKEFRTAGDYPWPLDAGYWGQVCPSLPEAVPAVAAVMCTLRGAWIAFASLGFHAVGVFLVLSGFTLALGAARKGIGPLPAWYRSRLVRLFPLYWIAHLLYLASPPAIRREAIDYRFVLSLLGDRIYPLGEIFFYANAAWWYFGLLLQLYLVFPLLFGLHRRMGPGPFLAAAALLTLVTRYLVLVPLASQHSGALLLGALFTCRLFEFCAGIALGVAYAAGPQIWLGCLRRPAMPALGLAIYAAGLFSYRFKLAYVATDALIGCGLAAILVAVALRVEARPRLGAALARAGAYSYGLYLFHQPYMIWVASLSKGATLGAFSVVAGLATAVLCVLSMVVEERVNRQVNRWFG